MGNEGTNKVKCTLNLTTTSLKESQYIKIVLVIDCFSH